MLEHTYTKEGNVAEFTSYEPGTPSWIDLATTDLAGAKAFGPLLQGQLKPYHDLSRGCSVDDIVLVSAISSVQV